MDTAKYKILKETLDTPFDIDRFKKFTREFFNGPNMLPATRQVGIWREYEEYVLCYYRIAEYIDREDNKLIVLAVELKKGRSVELARSMQRNFVSKILDHYDYNGAIVAFYSGDEPNWRLSFVRLDYTLTEKGLDIDLTPARRYSYLVGENEPKHTAEAQLFPLFKDDKSNPTLEEIEEAFSVERVTKDFFNRYKEKYLQLKEFLENDDNFIMESKKLGFETDKFAEQFSKKLMGQLAFLYFVQKKGWLGVTLLPEDRQLFESEYQKIYQTVDEPSKRVLEKYFVKQGGRRRLNGSLMEKEMTDYEAELLSDCFVRTEYDMPWGTGDKRFIRTLCDYCINETEKNFFNYYLEPLFYEALNKKRKNDYYKRFNCKIPFLNGGLFEPLEGYHWKDVKFQIPNHIFSNKKDEDDREADGILDIFDRYNFTINENEPLEKEIAVDPEMLGKIFENLLEVKDRKSKGAFYTPREIVHYMCQESLINYLVNEVDVPYEDMREFILYGELIRDVDSRSGVRYTKDLKIRQSILNNIIEIDKALENVRVADPAVGSGAFPLGMLNEIVRARNNITEYIIYVNKDNFRGAKYKEEIFRKQRSPYRMKLKTIKDCIFAVDIEPSAVDIAKLRLWLSIIVDQEIDEEYSKPQPLPNLDSNILVGNSLIDEYEGIKLFDKSILEKHGIQNGKSQDLKPEQLQMNLLIDYTDTLLNEMFSLQNQLFNETNEDKKKEIKKDIDDIRDELITYTLEQNGNHEGLKKYNQLKDEKTKPYFIWELEFARVFQEKGGFDIVIGNPPYIGFHNVPNKKYFKNKYVSASGKYDFYVLFIEEGINLLKQKGYISYICPSYFYKRNYGRKIRELILESCKIKFIADFKDSQIFDSATTYTCIFGFEKSNDNKANQIRIVDKDLKKDKYYKVNQNLLTEPIWMLDSPDSMKLINNIKNKSQYTFESVVKSISQGIVTGNNSVFILNEEMIHSRKINMNFLQPIYKGKDIRNGKLVHNKEYVFYPYTLDNKKRNVLIGEEEIRKENPNLYIYLLEKKGELLSRKYFVKSNKKWYELWNPRKKIHFLNRKFVFSEVNDRNDFVLCNECFYSDSACGAELREEFMKYEEYIFKYLNSELITKLYKKISVPKANGYLIYKNAFLKDLPVYIPNDIDKEYEKIISMSKSEFEEWLSKEFDINTKMI